VDTAVLYPKWACLRRKCIHRSCQTEFFQRTVLQDPKGLFNAGLGAKLMRSIDFQRGDPIPEAALQDLVRAAVVTIYPMEERK